jgi:hypothetical protein
VARPFRSILVLAIACAALLAPAAANAASFVNGDFETGNLNGWQTSNTIPDCGNWFAYTGTEAPSGSTVSAPPQGAWGAVSDEFDCGNTAFLYQDVTLELGWTHQLSMYVYYESRAPIVVPSPNTFAFGEFDNQQMRVDVIKPTAPIDTLNPDDILATVFANKTGDAESLPPTVFTADLSPFAGQTVRLRAAVAAGDFYFEGSVDDVKLTSTPPSNVITRGKLTLNKKKGTGRLAITVPGPGTLLEIAKGKRKKVKRANLTVTGPGTVQLPLKPTAKGLKILNAKGKLKTRVDVFFTPTGGTAGVQTYKVTLKKTLK